MRTWCSQMEVAAGTPPVCGPTGSEPCFGNYQKPHEGFFDGRSDSAKPVPEMWCWKTPGIGSFRPEGKGN